MPAIAAVVMPHVRTVMPVAAIVAAAVTVHRPWNNHNRWPHDAMPANHNRAMRRLDHHYLSAQMRRCNNRWRKLHVLNKGRTGLCDIRAKHGRCDETRQYGRFSQCPVNGSMQHVRLLDLHLKVDGPALQLFTRRPTLRSNRFTPCMNNAPAHPSVGRPRNTRVAKRNRRQTCHFFEFSVYLRYNKIHSRVHPPTTMTLRSTSDELSALMS